MIKTDVVQLPGFLVAIQKMDERISELEQTVKKLEAALESTKDAQICAIQTQRNLLEQLQKEMRSEELLDKLDRLEKSNGELSRRVATVERNSEAIKAYLSALDDLMQTVADNVNQEAEFNGTV